MKTCYCQNSRSLTHHHFSIGLRAPEAQYMSLLWLGGFSAFQSNSSKAENSSDLRTHLSSSLFSVGRSCIEVPCLGLKLFYAQMCLSCKTKKTKETGFVPLLGEGMTRRKIVEVFLYGYRNYCFHKGINIPLGNHQRKSSYQGKP